MGRGSRSIGTAASKGSAPQQIWRNLYMLWEHLCGILSDAMPPLANDGSRPPRPNGSGADAAERHRAVLVSVSLTYHLPNPNPAPRGRRDRMYPREEVPVYRSFSIALPSTVLDPRTGPRQVGTAVGTYLARRLIYEGWPHQGRVSDLDVRPGLSG